MNRLRIFVFVFGFVALSRAEEVPPLVPIEDYTGDFGSRSRMTGDWGGVRTSLAEHGFQLELNNTTIYSAIVDGGKSSDSEFGGNLELILRLDSKQLGLWPGGMLFLRAERYYDENINGDTGALFPANGVALFPEPNDNDLALSHLQITQFLSPHFGISLGKMDTSTGDVNEFAHGRADTKFLNAAFAFNLVTAATMPYAPLGAAIVILPTGDPETMLSISAVDTDGTAMESGFDTAFDGGTSFAGEFRLKTDFFGQRGHQLVGVTWSNDEFINLGDAFDISLPRLLGRGRNERNTEYDSPAEEFAARTRAIIRKGLMIKRYINQIDRENSSWSAYYNFDQNIHAEADDPTQGFGLFGRIGFADDDTNPIASFFSLGIGGKGIIPSRDNDRFGIGWYYMNTSSELPGDLGLGHEQGVEIFYNIAVTPWLQITPDIQIINPAVEKNDTTVVLGIRGHVRF